MAFYDSPKEVREQIVKKIGIEIEDDLRKGISSQILNFFQDEDTYIRKSVYLAIGKIYFKTPTFQLSILGFLEQLFENEDFKVRQTVINAAGEIGKKDFLTVVTFFDRGLFDPHHSPRNAVIGSIKKMGEVNPRPVLEWARNYLHHPNKEIRREICHGIELRGRKYPQDILPLLKELQFDKTARVRNTLVHVLGQIAYKKGCLETVVSDLKSWENKTLVEAAILEIIDVHDRYKDFSFYTQTEARDYIEKEFKFG